MTFITKILTLFLFTGITFAAPLEEDGKHPGNSAREMRMENCYLSCELEGKLDFEIFENAMESLDEMEYMNEDIVSIIDFSKPSTEKRLFILDLKNQKLLYHTYVAHGKNTGQNEALKFSNTKGSNSSSLGLYSTAESYVGKHGYSLRLDGLEKGFNDNARSRAVVMHSANYVSEDFIKKYGRLGRSFGCPAVPVEHSKEIIDLIKGGSCLYIYADDETYLENSILAD
ncbi:MAG: murein L,D-transpeptidase catalytic domain family protein [Bacteroides sp.]|nr:murein L,D-transpeptidase catalytic domain family protein [Bacteroides sp.]